MSLPAAQQKRFAKIAKFLNQVPTAVNSSKRLDKTVACSETPKRVGVKKPQRHLSGLSDEFKTREYFIVYLYLVLNLTR